MRIQHWLYTIPLRLRSLFQRRHVEQELDEELRYHVEHLIQEYVSRGMKPRDARNLALRAMGGVEQQKERCRSMRRVNIIDDLIRDLSFGLRMLRKSPAFTAVALLSLALGIGANTAIFQLLDTIRLRNLPVQNPQQLVRIRVQNGNTGMGITRDYSALTYPLWEELRRHHQTFSNVFAWSDDDFEIGEGSQTRNAKGLLVSGEFFSTLGLGPVIGRLLDETDDKRGCGNPPVVVSYGFWQTEFGGNASVIGNRIVIGERRFQIVGVTPASFYGLEVGTKFDFALPICAQTIVTDRTASLDRRDVWWVTAMGRLKNGTTTAQASQYLQTISSGFFAATVPTGYSASTLDAYRKFQLEAIPAANGISSLRKQYDQSLWLLLGIAGLVLLIACANLANLMLARASTREREFAVRLALGASRGRLIRQLLCESLLLAIAGAVAGLMLSRFLSQTIFSLIKTEGSNLHLDLSMDWRMLAFTSLIAGLCCLIFGLLPAIRSSQTEVGVTIKTGGRGMTAGREGLLFQRLLVTLQISISMVLIVSALLFVKSFRNLVSLDPGFRESGMVVSTFNSYPLRLPENEVKTFQRTLLEEVRSVPNVDAAATTTKPFLNDSSWSFGVRLGDVEDQSKFTWVSPGFFNTMQIPVLAGRDFNSDDTETSPKVAIVNQTFVRRFLNGGSAVGKTFRTVAEPGYPEQLHQIVGVIPDTKYSDIRDETPPMSFVPASQNPGNANWTAMYIRSSAPLSGVIAAVRDRIGQSHPAIKMDFRVFETQIAEGLIRERLMAALSGFFGLLAVLLSCLGLFGVLSYMTARRTNEIGIRMALGATRFNAVGVVLKETLLMVFAGIGFGVVAMFATTRLISSLLFGINPTDPSTVIAAVILMMVVAALAVFLPAHKASRVDPMTALRYE